MNKPQRIIEILTECNTSGVFALSFFSGATFVNSLYRNATYFNNRFAIDCHWNNIRREICSWHLPNVDTEHLQLLVFSVKIFIGIIIYLTENTLCFPWRPILMRRSSMCTISCTESVIFVWSEPKLVCVNRY